MRVTILGCGSSGGVPAVGLGWGRCRPDNPRNRRLRPSILVQESSTNLLVDTSPDLRQQLLNADVRRLDAVLYTHAHADHLHGIDDLRGINRAMQSAIPAYADAPTWQGIRARFAYALDPLKPDATIIYKPTLAQHEIKAGETLTIAGIPVQAFDQNHGYSRTLGFRFGPIAYSTDLVDLPEEAFEALAGVRTWIIGVLSETPHPTHAHVEKALGWIKRVGPTRAVLTHLSPDLDYDELMKQVPKGVEAAYDGMALEEG
ncbi:MAG: MBL fold metallo-hydrolase [Rhodospirillales bacterium]|nr:MBL fold metallo-hydrolase [Rhodospirillales bacterium]